MARVFCRALTYLSPGESFVNKNAHRSDGFQDRQLASFDDGNHLFALDCWKPVEEVLNGLAAIQRVDQILERDASAHKHGRAAHDLRVAMNDALEFFQLHEL